MSLSLLEIEIKKEKHYWRKTNSLDMKVGFIHILALPQQVIKYWSEAPFMPMEMTCKAISVIVAEQIESIE